MLMLTRKRSVGGAFLAGRSFRFRIVVEREHDQAKWKRYFALNTRKSRRTNGTTLNSSQNLLSESEKYNVGFPLQTPPKHSPLMKQGTRYIGRNSAQLCNTSVHRSLTWRISSQLQSLAFFPPHPPPAPH